MGSVPSGRHFAGESLVSFTSYYIIFLFNIFFHQQVVEEHAPVSGANLAERGCRRGWRLSAALHSAEHLNGGHG